MKTSIIDGRPLPESEDEFYTNLARMRIHYCSDCKQIFGHNVHTPAGWRETQITGMCEDCFDALFAQEKENDQA